MLPFVSRDDSVPASSSVVTPLISKSPLGEWQPIILSTLEILRKLAGTTENEFLQIGEQMQGIYLRSAEISKMANHLVEVASGERMQSLLERLRQMMSDMEAYLSSARARSNESCTTLHGVQDLLVQVAKPLQGFMKMNMTLHMLGVSIKIESARLGRMGNEFVNLALDVEKLSRQVNDKSSAILEHRQALLSTIIDNMETVQATESVHDADVSLTLNNTSSSLHELESANERFIQLGGKVAAISSEITNNIGEVVSSMQFHDINRQQVEHIIEALERLVTDIAGADIAGADSGTQDEGRRRALVVETGDVCELQEAQLHFASSELYAAVSSIVENLGEVGKKQTVMARETLAATGVMDASGTSFVDRISSGMASVTEVLTSCLGTDRDMAATMQKVAATISEITAFVHDIDEIGFEIVLLALNAQIKAAHTGGRGAALGVLAEAIRQLSDEAVQRTNTVAVTLTEIHTATEHLSVDANDDEADLCAKLKTMEAELAEILTMLGAMNDELLAVLSQVQGKVASLTEEVETITSQIDVHQRTKAMADEVLAALSRIVGQARELEPASTEFKENLRLMEERYTMESERHIHEAIARKRSGQAEASVEASVSTSNSESDTEFGDNVDLF